LDSIELKKVFDSVLNEKAEYWSNNMIGYGSYHYKSERSKQEGDWPLIAFSPRKQYISLYIMSGASNYQDLLNKLGKYKAGSGSCIYINKLEDINIDVLKEIIVKPLITNRTGVIGMAGPRYPVKLFVILGSLVFVVYNGA
jgi:hypothetical protein